jgi:hypothetical protein
MNVSHNVTEIVEVVLGQCLKAAIDLADEVEDAKLLVREPMRFARGVVRLIGHV